MKRDRNARLFREFAISEAKKNDDRTLQLSFSSEKPYDRWFGPEVLLHEEKAVDLTRLQEIGVLLWNHHSDIPIGQVTDVTLDEENHRCTAIVRFDSDEQSDLIYQKVLSGTLKGVSVGYVVTNWEDVEKGHTSMNGRFMGPVSIATRWEPLEISIVSVPADPSVGVGRSAEGYSKKENEMPEEKNKPILGAENLPAPEKNEERQEGSQADAERAAKNERNRTVEIMAICRQFGMDAEEYIKSGASVEVVKDAALAKKAKEEKPVPITIGEDDKEKFAKKARDGFAMHVGLNIEKPTDGAEEFRGFSLVRMAEECLERAGEKINHADEEGMVRAALGNGTGMLPGILSNAANKSMAEGYQMAETTFQYWTKKGSNNDFKDAVRYRLSEAEELEKVNEGGEIKDSTFTEASAKASVGTFARKFSLTRQAIINDDLSALTQIPAAYGAAARRMINKMVYKMLEENPKIEGAELFSTKHGNTGKGLISVEGIGIGRAAMKKQKGIGGKAVLNISPAFLIVPAELETLAEQLIASVVDPTKNNATPNPFANKMRVIADAELADPKAWYLAASQGTFPGIEVTYLRGREQPTVEQQVAFDTLGVRYRIYMDVGVNLLDFRGMYKSSGEKEE